MFIVLSTLLSCSKPAPPPIPAVSAPLPDMSDEMEDHFYHALRLQLAVVGGDLGAAHQAASELEAVTAGGTYPEAWAPFLEATRTLAQRAAKTTSVPETAAALADVGLVCAQCHRATGGGPRERVDERVPDEPMGRHLYGTYWMGYGLIAPDDRAWFAGAVALASREHWPSGPPAVLTQMSDLSAEAVAAKTPEERAVVWGQLLSTCAACHTTIPR
jgi:mono/diheme cytochrome c family protein